MAEKTCKYLSGLAEIWLKAPKSAHAEKLETPSLLVSHLKSGKIIAASHSFGDVLDDIVKEFLSLYKTDALQSKSRQGAPKNFIASVFKETAFLHKEAKGRARPVKDNGGELEKMFKDCVLLTNGEFITPSTQNSLAKRAAAYVGEQDPNKKLKFFRISARDNGDSARQPNTLNANAVLKTFLSARKMLLKYFLKDGCNRRRGTL